MKLKLKHIGAISLGKILGVWGFIISEILVLLISAGMVLMALIGASGDSGGIGSAIMYLVFGSIGSVGTAIVMFIIGALTALIYTIILKVGGGLELEFEEIK